MSTDVLDPGFDAGPSAIGGVINFTPFQAATLRTETSLSRTGDGGVLEISYWNESAVMFLETWVFVPESNGEEGPAVDPEAEAVPGAGGTPAVNL